MDTMEFKSDHDILVTLVEQVKQVREDIKDLKEGTTIRILSLERDKADRRDVELLQIKVNKDIEMRMEKLENWQSERKEWGKSQSRMLQSIIAIGTLILGILIWHLTGYNI